MTLLVSLFAALISTILWYKRAPDDGMKLGTLSLIYWGASLMWLVDAAAGYIEEGAAFFEPPVSAMVNDLFLGLCVVALGLCIWLVVLLIRDPKGVVRASLFKRK